MSYYLEKLEDHIAAAIKAATLESASFGFDSDLIEVKSAHASVDFAPGAQLHPTDYIRKVVDLHHRSWIIGPLKEALQLIQQNRRLLQDLEAVREQLARTNIEALQVLARAGMKDG